MKVGLSWLEQYFLVKPDWSLVFDKLTQAGIEIEDIEEESDDKIIEFKITPNRGDCLSVVGLLREIAVLSGYDYKYIFDQVVQKAGVSNTQLKVEVHATLQCPVYTGAVIEGVNNQARLPDYIVSRIEKSGLRSVSPVVDIANYVMLETGQPLHTFDAKKVDGRLQVRFATANQELALLDGGVAKLDPKTLVIADSNNKPLAIAGVMGGVDSGVDADTQNVIIESAFFTPEVIAGVAKRYNLSSDAAYRFERGVDFTLQKPALIMAMNLISQYLGGWCGEIIELNHLATQANSSSIEICGADFTRMTGVELNCEVIKDILYRLGFKVVDGGGESLAVSPPPFRFDIKIKEDVIEEIARVYGYDKITPILPVTGYTMLNINSDYTKINWLKHQLVARGYNEIISYSFLEFKYANLFNYVEALPIELKNSIAGLGYLRTSLFGGLIKSMEYNITRNFSSIKLFELSRVFYGEAEELQPLRLSGLWYGNTAPTNWDQSLLVDFFDIKGDVEVLLSGVKGIRFVLARDIPVLHSGRCAKIYSYDRQVGIIGELHPKIAQELGLEVSPYLFELDVGAICDANVNFKVVSTSKYQKVERDLAFVMEKTFPVGMVADHIYGIDTAVIKAVKVFDVFSGGGIEENQKSVAFKIMFQADKTLTDEEINSYLEKIIKEVKHSFGFSLR